MFSVLRSESVSAATNMYEHEPCHQVLADTTYVFTTSVHAAQRCANKVHAVATRGVSDKAMSFGQAMAHTEAQGLKQHSLTSFHRRNTTRRWKFSETKRISQKGV